MCCIHFHKSAATSGDLGSAQVEMWLIFIFIFFSKFGEKIPKNKKIFGGVWGLRGIRLSFG
jgi:hypothetical protein